MKNNKNENQEPEIESAVEESGLIKKLMSSEDDQIIEVDEQGEIVFETAISEDATAEAVKPKTDDMRANIVDAPSFAKKAFGKYEQSEVDVFVNDLIAKHNELIIAKELEAKATLRRSTASAKISKDLTEARKTIKSLQANIEELEARTPDAAAIEIIEAANKEAELIITEAEAKSLSTISKATNEAIASSNKAYAEAEELVDAAMKHVSEIVENAKARAKEIVNEANAQSEIIKADAQADVKTSQDFLARRQEVNKRLKDFYQTQIDLLNSEENNA